MNEQVLRRLWPVAASVLVLPVLVALWWGHHAALGVFAGGVWNLVNLWCLVRLLIAGLGPQRSNTRVVGWLLVKFLLLYAVAFQLLRDPAVSLVGFSIGFSVVLVTVVTFLALRTRQLIAPVSHER